MEEDVSRPFNLPYLSHQNSIHSQHPGTSRGLGQRVFSRRALRRGHSTNVRRRINDLSPPIPPILTHPQISPREFRLPPTSRIFNLAISFPLLEDLTVNNDFELPTYDGNGYIVHLPSRPVFTGSLGLFMWGGMKPIACRLLSLSSGIHFRKLSLRWTCAEDLLLTKALVEKCSHTLKSLDITRTTHGRSIRDLHPHR